MYVGFQTTVLSIHFCFACTDNREKGEKDGLPYYRNIKRPLNNSPKINLPKINVENCCFVTVIIVV